MLASNPIGNDDRLAKGFNVLTAKAKEYKTRKEKTEWYNKLLGAALCILGASIFVFSLCIDSSPSLLKEMSLTATSVNFLVIGVISQTFVSDSRRIKDQNYFWFQLIRFFVITLGCSFSIYHAIMNTWWIIDSTMTYQTSRLIYSIAYISTITTAVCSSCALLFATLSFRNSRNGPQLAWLKKTSMGEDKLEEDGALQCHYPMPNEMDCINEISKLPTHAIHALDKKIGTNYIKAALATKSGKHSDLDFEDAMMTYGTKKSEKTTHDTYSRGLTAATTSKR